MDEKTKGRRLSGLSMVGVVVLQLLHYYGVIADAGEVTTEIIRLPVFELIKITLVLVGAWGLVLLVWEPSMEAIERRWERRKERRAKEEEFKELFGVSTDYDRTIIQDLLDGPIEMAKGILGEGRLIEKFVLTIDTRNPYTPAATTYIRKLDPDVEKIAKKCVEALLAEQQEEWDDSH